MSNKNLFSEFPPVTTKEWEEVINKDLKGADYDKKLVWNTAEGFKVQPYYRAEDLARISYLQSEPGAYPFVRGNKTEENQWDIRQDIEVSNPQQANKLALDAVARGAEYIGFFMQEVDSQDKMAVLLNGLDLTKTKVRFLHVKSYKDTLAFFVNYLNTNKIDAKKVFGSIDFDPFSYALTHGAFYQSWEENIAETKFILDSYSSQLPNFHLLTVNGCKLHAAGANITQELGYTLAAAHDYLNALVNAGVSVDVITHHMMFSFAAGSNYFMEIAKIRAARLLWAHVVEQYQPKSKDSEKIYIHSSTSKWNQSIYDPYVNMLRSTTEAMSLAIAGADSISVTPFDHAYRKADDFSSRIARNQQILLKEESLLDKVVDPSAGSYYIETLTDNVAQYAWKIFQEVEEMGGFALAIKNNAVQEAIEKTALQRNMDIATRKIILLGTNQYPNLTETFTANIESETAGSVVAEFKSLKEYRGAQAFEELRLKLDQEVKAGKKRPLIFLLTYGNLNMRKARAGFASNFFGCAGFDVVDNAGFATAEEGVKAAMDKKADVVVLCSSDEEYESLVPAACNALKTAGFKGNITLAGDPKEQKEAYQAAGVNEFISVKSNVLETLKKY